MPSGEAKRRKLVPEKGNATTAAAKFWAGPTPLFARMNDDESTVKLWSAKSIPVWGETIAMATVAMASNFVPDWVISEETTQEGAV